MYPHHSLGVGVGIGAGVGGGGGVGSENCMSGGSPVGTKIWEHRFWAVFGTKQQLSGPGTQM